MPILLDAVDRLDAHLLAVGPDVDLRVQLLVSILDDRQLAAAGGLVVGPGSGGHVGVQRLPPYPRSVAVHGTSPERLELGPDLRLFHTEDDAVEKNVFATGQFGVEAGTNFGLVSFDNDGNAVLGQGLSLGFMQTGDLRMLLRAVTSTVDANILSRPSIVTLDNQEAEILVGQNIPLITGNTVAGDQTVCTNDQAGLMTGSDPGGGSSGFHTA